MKIGSRHEYLTEYIIRRIDRENRAAWFRSITKRVRHIWRRAVREALRFTALTAGTSLFAFIAVPAMELYPERTIIIAELLAVLAFGMWLGGRIYEPKNRK